MAWSTEIGAKRSAPASKSSASPATTTPSATELLRRAAIGTALLLTTVACGDAFSLLEPEQETTSLLTLVPSRATQGSVDVLLVGLLTARPADDPENLLLVEVNFAESRQQPDIQVPLVRLDIAENAGCQNQVNTVYAALETTQPGLREQTIPSCLNINVDQDAALGDRRVSLGIEYPNGAVVFGSGNLTVARPPQASPLLPEERPDPDRGDGDTTR